VLEKEVSKVVRAAEESMTPVERETIARRNKKVTMRPERSESRGEGPSEPKGKSIDPREWGNAGLSDEDLNLDTQRAALESYSKSKKVNRHKSKSGRHSKQRKVKPAEMRPEAQIDPKSYLGVTLKKIGKGTSRKRRDPSLSSSDSTSKSSSLSESSSSESESSESDSDSDKSEPKLRRRKDKHRKPKAKRSRVKGSKLLKPKSYNGEPDSRIFNRFVRESQAYLKAYGVPRKEQAFTLSYFLEGKAYNFYVQKVSLNEAKWSLSDFYTGLFNFSFPINYRMQMRKKLDKYYQNDKTVMEYVHGLEEFFNMIGSVTKRERVLKFWKGIRLQIQKALWRDGLNPEVSTWEEVIEQAEIIEISESVVNP